MHLPVELRTAVMDLLDSLPEERRLPLWLCGCLGFGLDEAAALLAIAGDAGSS